MAATGGNAVNIALLAAPKTQALQFAGHRGQLPYMAAGTGGGRFKGGRAWHMQTRRLGTTAYC